MIEISEAQLMRYVGEILLPMFRLLGMFGAAPILSNRSFPIRTRVGLALLMAAIVGPFSNVGTAVTIGTAQWFGAVLYEVMLGLALGFTARLILAGIELAGELIGLQMGLSFAGFFDPQSGTANAVGRLVSTLSLLTFVVIDGPQILILAVIRSFAVFPIGTELMLPTTAERFARMGSGLFSTALTIAMPIATMQLIINLVLGVISRIAPQFNVFSVGFPATIAAGLLMLALSTPALDRSLVDTTEQLLRLLGL
jgi:flagellar biosynthetic protein FliR